MVEYWEAGSQDFELVHQLGLLMHQESSYSKLKFSKDKLLDTFGMYLHDDNKVVFIAVDGDKPLGLYAGYISEYYFSEELVANDIAWFVVREKRGTRIGLRLLDCFEHWAKERGASEIRIGYSTDINPAAFDSLMKKRKYSMVGANYRLES